LISLHSRNFSSFNQTEMAIENADDEFTVYMDRLKLAVRRTDYDDFLTAENTRLMKFYSQDVPVFTEMLGDDKLTEEEKTRLDRAKELQEQS